MKIRKKRIRWGRVVLVLLLLAIFITSLTGIAVYAWNSVIGVRSVSKDHDIEKERVTERINILLLGLDEGEQDVPESPKLADSIMLASINPKDKSVSLLSIPRETKVTVPGYKNSDQIMYAYYYGGPELAVRTAADFLHIPIHHYLAVNSKSFINLVDQAEGVNLYVESDMDYEDSYADLSIHLKKGYQHLSGKEANYYVRFRQDELGDIGRMQRQQRFIKNFSNELFQANTLLKLPYLISSFNKHAYTDMKTLTLMKLIAILRNCNESSFYTDMLPGKSAVIGDKTYWITNKDQVKQTTQRLLTE